MKTFQIVSRLTQAAMSLLWLAIYPQTLPYAPPDVLPKNWASQNWSRHSQLIEPDFTLTGTKVVAALKRVTKRTGYPQMITVDNGIEFTSKALDVWAYAHGVKFDFIRPGKPLENAVIESFNGRCRDECLNTQVFVSLHDARQKIETCRVDYNEHRPHGSLGDLTPQEFVEQTAQTGLQEASSFQHGVV